MLGNDNKTILGHRLFAENGVDKRRKPLSLESVVTFLSSVVRYAG
jgi:hypothetical protein